MLEAETGNLQSKPLASLVDESSSGFNKRLCLSAEGREKLKKISKVNFTCTHGHTHSCALAGTCVSTQLETRVHKCLNTYMTNIYIKFKPDTLNEKINSGEEIQIILKCVKMT